MTDNLSTLALAFLGDAIHTGQKEKLNTYNNKAKSFCNALSQAKALDKVFDLLDDEENDIVRKTRNTKNKHGAKNFDEETYKKATSFEALIGFLYLTKNKEKLAKILQKSMEI